jgi:LPS-assembly protein
VLNIFLVLKNKLPILILIILTICGKAISEEQSTFSPEDVRIIANYKEQIEERVIASGNVEIHYKNLTLFADRIELDRESRDVYAEGNVVILMPNEVVSCKSIFFNLDTSQGELEEVVGKIQPTVFYEAESVEREDENVYRFQKARLTSCTQPVPRWKFSCSKATFKKDEYMEMWNAVLYIKKIPVFYFPYLRYPLDRERSTGFLMPTLGYTGRKGFYFSEGFFWAIKRNMDATLNLDYYSTRGLGGGLEFRYLFSKGTTGQLNLYYFRFKEEPGEETPEPAHLIRFQHNQFLPLKFTLSANVDLQSSYDFLREFDNNFKRAVVSNRRTQVYLSRAWSYYNLNMRASRFETYYASQDASIVIYHLPQVSFSSFKMKLFSPFHFSFSSSFRRYQHFNLKGKETTSQSIALSPVLNFPFTQIPWLVLNTSFASNFNYYFQSYKPYTKKVIAEPLLVTNYVFNVEIIGPTIYRIYRDDEDEPRLKHIIEPSFTYRYESPIDAERVINYRRYYRLHQFKYGITNRFLVKEGEMPREVLSLGLEQVFYVSPEDSPLNIYLVDGEIPDFSDIKGIIRFYPSTKYSIDFSGALNPYYTTLSSIRLGANLGTLRDSLFLRVSWFKGINPYREEAIWNRHQISCFAGVKIPKLSVEAQGQISYNIQERKMLYSAFNFVYHYQCIDLRADLRIFYYREKPEVQFGISFGLGNIGKTTDFLGGLGF